MKSIIRYFQRWLFLAMDYLIFTFCQSPTSNNLALVRLDAIGDFIIWLDSAKEYRSIFFDRRISLIANAAWADLARGLPYWDEVIAIDIRRFTRNPLYRWTRLSMVIRGNFELAIQPTFSRVLLHGDSVIRATRATLRIGSIGDMNNISVKDQAIGNRWYTRLVPASPKAMMELQRNAEFISHLTDKTFNARLPKLPVLTTLPKRLQPQVAYFILFPGASWHGRQWPSQCFAQVLARVHRRYGFQAVLCGSPADGALCQAVADDSQVGCLNFAGQTSLAELTELIRGARLLIGSETSAVHIAAAVGTPVVCILGGGHFGRFMPYPETLVGLKPSIAVHQMPCFHCNWRCNQPHDPAGPVPCVSRISVELVMCRAMQAIEQAHPITLVNVSAEVLQKT